MSKSINIHIINVSKESRKLFDSFFSHIEANVIYTSGVEDAIETLQTTEASLILFQLSQEDSQETENLDKIVQVSKSKSPIVVLIENPKKELVSACVKAGAKGFLKVPVDKQLFVKTIKKLIQITPKKKTEENKSASNSEEHTNRKNDKDELITDLVEKLKNDKLDFSTMPQLGYKIIELLKDDSTPLVKVNEYIEKDPGIYARVLKAANSAVFAGAKPVFIPKDAILRIGVKRTINYILVISSARLFAHPNPIYSDLLKDVLKHSICTAICAREIALEINHPNADNYFAFGLLHDIGKVLLLRILNQLSKQRNLDDLIFLELMLRQLHTQFGATLMKKWNFPHEFYEVILRHHEEPDIAKHNKPTVITALANLMAHEIDEGTFKENAKKLIKLPHMRLLGYRPKKFNELEATVLKEQKIMMGLL